MQPSPAPSAEDAFMAALLSLGHRMRQRLPGDAVESSLLPVLRVLGQCGPVRHTALAAWLSLDASTVSRKVRQLEEHGLVRVTHDEQDGRARKVELLPAGQDALAQSLDRRKDIIGEVLADWPAADREQLRTLLLRFNDDLDSSSAPELRS